MMPKYIIKLLPDMSQPFRNFTEDLLKMDVTRYVIFIPLNYDGNKRIACNNYSEWLRSIYAKRMRRFRSLLPLSAITFYTWLVQFNLHSFQCGCFPKTIWQRKGYFLILSHSLFAYFGIGFLGGFARFRDASPTLERTSPKSHIILGMQISWPYFDLTQNWVNPRGTAGYLP